jgi:hypothetical protein
MFDLQWWAETGFILRCRSCEGVFVLLSRRSWDGIAPMRTSSYFWRSEMERK